MNPTGTLTDTQKIPFSFQAQDAKGNPCPPSGPLVVTIGDPTMLSSTVDAHDGSSAPVTGTLTALGPVTPAGTPVAVQMTDGVATAQGSLTITGGAEAAAALTFGAPVAQ